MTAGPVVARAGEPGPGRVAARGEVRDPVLSVVVMHHPARGDVSGLVRACAPLDVRVVEDPDPDGPPSPLRTAKRAWAAVAPGATHHLVLQDDVAPVAGFAELVRRAVRARPRHAVALYSNWNSPRNAYLVRAAAAAGQAWAPLGHDEWVPTLGLVLPADGARRLAAHLATLPDDARDDDEAVVAFCARERYAVVATLPHLLEHGDGPSLAGNDAHGARHATVPAGDVVDPDAWDRPGPERTPSRVPATLRPVAVTLERSRCTLRVLRPTAGEPLEHPFGWAWDAWAGWLGVHPAAVAHDVAALAAGVCPRLGGVAPAALVELGAACWLLGSDVARTAWPPPAGPGTTAHRAAAVRTWVLSGLLPADRPESRVDELVAFGLDALAAGAAWAATARDATAGGASPAGPARPGPGARGDRPDPAARDDRRGPAAGDDSPHPAAHDDRRGPAALGDRLDPAALDAVRVLAERDAAVVCRVAGPAVPVRVVVHDCASCGAQAADAVADLAAHGDLDGAAEHLVADEQDVVDEHGVVAEHGVAATAVGSDETVSSAGDGTGRPHPAPGGPDPVHGDGRTKDARATVEVLACERLEVRGFLGLVPGGRHVSRGLWAARRASAAGGERLDAADLLVALADEAASLPVVARAVGEPLGRPSRAPLGLQHATGAAQEYADRYAAARSARAAEPAVSGGPAGVWRWRGDALLLDLDGTLVDSSAAIERHTLAWAARLGLDGEAVVAASHGRRDVEVVRLVAPGADVAREVAWLHRLSCDDTEGVVAVPGAAELLAGLDARTWTVVTSAAREVALARLTAAGLPVPGRLVCSEDVTRGKPDPEGFRAGARLLGVDPRRCLVLEDSAAGVAAGRGATAAVLAVGPEPVPGAHHRVPDLRPLAARPLRGGLEVLVRADRPVRVASLEVVA